MSTNILVAIKNLLEYGDNKILDFYTRASNNRANNMGDALEYFVKDLFCSSLKIEDFDKKDEIYSNYLSYLGNKNNPPDFIIKKSSAIEVKKVENLSFGNIALNSSYPKDYLYSTSTLISDACKTCENEFGGWTKKRMIYAVGNVMRDKLRVLWLVDGACYCADDNVYKKIKINMQEGINSIPGVEFAETNELGKVKKIDPLGITDLRIRGMWSIKHPMKVFDYLVRDYNKDTNLQLYCLMLKDKYDKICDNDKNSLEEYIKNGKLIKQDVRIKNPNNPAKFMDAILYKASL
ncbi:MAG: NgoPII family restriction endonuclease [Romboutsia timonensis]|nr:NgoPII family restriction endonuclease [Romboutsia timonensis]